MQLAKYEQQIFLIILLALAFFFVYLALHTNMLGEDEAVYYSLAKDFSQGVFNAFSYNGRPAAYAPLLPLVTVPFFVILGSSLVVGKFVVAIFGILTAFVVYLIGKRVSTLAGLVSAFLLFSIPLFSQYMLLDYTEIPIAFFSALITYVALTMNSRNQAILLGAIMGIAFYMKGSAIVFPFIFLIYALFLWYRGNKTYLKHMFISILIFAALVAPWGIRNIYLFGDPYIEGLNIFIHTSKYSIPQWASSISGAISPQTDYFSIFGFVTILFATLGAVYSYLTRNKVMTFLTFISVLFLALYNLRFIVLHTIEPRYLTMVFPQLALLGGSFIAFAYEKFKPTHKFSTMFVVSMMMLLFLSYGIEIALATSHTVRYTSNYVSALTWVKANTPKNATIFTAYDGSVKVFAGRNTVWAAVAEFPQLMNTSDGTFIKSTLKSYNASYIVIWQGIIYSSYVIPGSNLLGAFTYNFLNVVSSDETDFKLVYSNAETAVYQIL